MIFVCAFLQLSVQVCRDILQSDRRHTRNRNGSISVGKLNVTLRKQIPGFGSLRAVSKGSLSLAAVRAKPE